MKIRFNSKSGAMAFATRLMEQETEFTFERGFHGEFIIVIGSILTLKSEDDLQLAELVGDAVVMQ